MYSAAEPTTLALLLACSGWAGLVWPPSSSKPRPPPLATLATDRPPNADATAACPPSPGFAPNRHSPLDVPSERVELNTIISVTAPAGPSRPLPSKAQLPPTPSPCFRPALDSPASAVARQLRSHTQSLAIARCLSLRARSLLVRNSASHHGFLVDLLMSAFPYSTQALGPQLCYATRAQHSPERFRPDQRRFLDQTTSSGHTFAHVAIPDHSQRGFCKTSAKNWTRSSSSSLSDSSSRTTLLSFDVSIASSTCAAATLLCLALELELAHSVRRLALPSIASTASSFISPSAPLNSTHTGAAATRQSPRPARSRAPSPFQPRRWSVSLLSTVFEFPVLGRSPLHSISIDSSASTRSHPATFFATHCGPTGPWLLKRAQNPPTPPDGFKAASCASSAASVKKLVKCSDDRSVQLLSISSRTHSCIDHACSHAPLAQTIADPAAPHTSPRSGQGRSFGSITICTSALHIANFAKKPNASPPLSCGEATREPPALAAPLCMPPTPASSSRNSVLDLELGCPRTPYDPRANYRLALQPLTRNNLKLVLRNLVLAHALPHGGGSLLLSVINLGPLGTATAPQGHGIHGTVLKDPPDGKARPVVVANLLLLVPLARPSLRRLPAPAQSKPLPILPFSAPSASSLTRLPPIPCFDELVLHKVSTRPRYIGCPVLREPALLLSPSPLRGSGSTHDSAAQNLRSHHPPRRSRRLLDNVCANSPPALLFLLGQSLCGQPIHCTSLERIISTRERHRNPHSSTHCSIFAPSSSLLS
ncbi:hypothetical protein PaG_04597 [Moesziomyces aphidis]|uniref:Uncharacterized protein n=1 Tax=Moesziomyces aphidis TaxID=84754 RepID=W3VGJ5_MOEAP|nr:hypothetical protein PaG_04597 [Moesziomyces aphidis]